MSLFTIKSCPLGLNHYGERPIHAGQRRTPSPAPRVPSPESRIPIRRFPEIHPALDAHAAAIEANRCLFCFDAPCTAACPTHIDVPRFIKKIATGNLRGSALTILNSNILGLSCSRVCPVDVLCEGACVMVPRQLQAHRNRPPPALRHGPVL